MHHDTPPLNPSHLTLGCVFRGTSQEVKDHKATCSYKDDTQLLAITMKEVCMCGCGGNVYMCVHMGCVVCVKLGFDALLHVYVHKICLDPEGCM